MPRNRMSALAERQSATNSRSSPPPRSAATRLCPAARSATAAPCSARARREASARPLRGGEIAQAHGLQFKRDLFGVIHFGSSLRRIVVRRVVSASNCVGDERQSRSRKRRRAPARETPCKEIAVRFADASLTRASIAQRILRQVKPVVASHRGSTTDGRSAPLGFHSSNAGGSGRPSGSFLRSAGCRQRGFARRPPHTPVRSGRAPRRSAPMENCGGFWEAQPPRISEH